jgi:hypothetical protein
MDVRPLPARPGRVAGERRGRPVGDALLPDGRHVVIVERDDQLAGNARIKRLYKVDLRDPSVEWKPFGETLDVVEKKPFADVLDELDERSIAIPDKLEGVGVTRNGRIYLPTDNDGVDESHGETLFFRLF